MPLLFLIVGAMFLTAAVRGKEQTDELLALIKSDFTGPNNFMVWAFAVGAIAGVGYLPKMRPISNAMLALIMLAIVLRNSGPDGSQNIFSSFYKQISE